MARPTIYTEETAELFCDLIATTSLSAKTICERKDMPSIRTIFYWLDQYPSFLQQYARAQEMRADFLIEETLEIADDASNDFMTVVKGDQVYEQENKEVTSRSKLRVDTRKWIASKFKPKKYGDKVQVDSNVTFDNRPPWLDAAK